MNDSGQFSLNRWHVVSLGLLVLLCVVGRLLPHAPNCTPVAASAMFAGYLLRSRRWAVLVPLTAMIVSDALIGGYEPRIRAVVYGSLALPVLFFPLLEGKGHLLRVGAAAMCSSIVFFLATNLAVWGFSPIYPQNAEGLGRCFAAAFPFFRHTLVGDLGWSVVLFGGYALAALFWPDFLPRRRCRVPVPVHKRPN